MYSRYLLAVEVGGTLLLIATVGAIVITGQGPRRRNA
jgi:NADH:ubiquinone oxidoreductase subunit 6 (subunit J)